MPLLPDSNQPPAPLPTDNSLELASALYLQGQLPSASSAGSGAAATGGWVSLTGTWVYATADSPTFTMTSTTDDYTTTLSVGMRIRLVQTTTKYFIVTAVSFSASTSTVTLYGGTDYTLANAAISSLYYSAGKAPVGFPTDPTKWTVTMTDTSDRTQASPVSGTWYNLGSLSISVPIGAWDVQYAAATVATNSGGGANFRARAALSTSASSVSDAILVGFAYGGAKTGATTDVGGVLSRRKTLVLAAKTTYYLIAETDAGGATIGFYASTYGCTTTVYAVSAYL